MLHNQIINCDCVEGMTRLRAESVPLTVTSPPYDDIRAYGGHPWNFDVFRSVADQLWRVTVPGGVVCWVIQDRIKGKTSGTKLRQALHFESLGFWIWAELILEVLDYRHLRNRYRQNFHTCYVLSKGKPRYLRILEDRRNKCAGVKSRRHQRDRDGNSTQWKSDKRTPTWGFRGAIWRYSAGSQATKDECVKGFPALMPEAMAEDLIVSFSMPGNLVLDPFSGAGTTAKMALLNNRDYLGFEVWPDAFWTSMQRIAAARVEHQRQLDAFVISS
jgi:site-specific DNA-methyltransferase (adenine-specific)